MVKCCQRTLNFDGECSTFALNVFYDDQSLALESFARREESGRGFGLAIGVTSGVRIDARESWGGAFVQWLELARWLAFG